MRGQLFDSVWPVAYCRFVVGQKYDDCHFIIQGDQAGPLLVGYYFARDIFVNVGVRRTEIK